MSDANQNVLYWDKLRTPPDDALRKISAGRLKGKSDINPQWRYQRMTEVFGPIGKGWKYVIGRLWTEKGANDEVFAFAAVQLYVKYGDEWSEAIPASGGSILVAKEKGGMHNSDEAFKMATTDALGTAMKMVGIAADVYRGKSDSKHAARDARNNNAGSSSRNDPSPRNDPQPMTQEQKVNECLRISGELWGDKRDDRLAHYAKHYSAKRTAMVSELVPIELDKFYTFLQEETKGGKQ